MAVGESLTPGTELTELKFLNGADWWLKWSDPEVLWNAQPTYIIVQAVFLLGGVSTLVHALCSRGRLPYLWLATVGHGAIVEAVSYYMPYVHNYWHSQTPLMLLGRRLPLHITALYPFFIYNAFVAVSKLRLPRWAEPFAVGLTTVLIDIPFDIVCVKFVHWTWHDTDPNIGDRHYWVPWTSYFFHLTFAAGLAFWFHFLHSCFGGRFSNRWVTNGFVKETVTAVLTSLLGTPTGVLGFIIVYHPLHDLCQIHSEVTFFVLFTVSLTLAWAGDRASKEGARPANGVRTATWHTWLLVMPLLVHYITYLAIAALGHPEREISTGLRETVGPCDHTVSELGVERRKYLCLRDYDEKYFDFHCLPRDKVPKDGALWYTICGTPFENRAEYVSIVSAVSFTAIMVFVNLHFWSAPESLFSSITKHGAPPKQKKN